MIRIDNSSNFKNIINGKKIENLSSLSLPPRVKGAIYYYLTVNVNKLTWLKSTTYKNKNSLYGMNYSKYSTKIKLLWWGDDTNRGSIFYPYIAGPNYTLSNSLQQNNDKINTNNYSNIKANRNSKIISITYPICCDTNELNLYFTDMKNVYFDLLVDGKTIGKAVINELPNLTKNFIPIHKSFPVYALNSKGDFEPNIISELDIEFILRKNQKKNKNGKLNINCLKFISF